MAPSMTPRSKAGGKYANPTVQILIGDRLEQFHVHVTCLRRTAFFEIHGQPTALQTPAPSPSRAGTPMQSPTPSDGTLIQDEPQIKVEVGREDEVVDGTASTVFVPTAMTSYTLKGLVYEPEAFVIIVNSLYNERPKTPLHRSDLRICRKAYVLALQYQMEGLQDDIVNCFRNFHVHYSIQFEDLLWLAKRISGDETVVCQVPIIQYLLEQCAFEIYKDGYDAFARGNAGFEPFLVHGDRLLRKELFKAVTQIAMHQTPADPATGINKWKVRDWPEYNPDVQPATANVDLIDIDN